MNGPYNFMLTMYQLMWNDMYHNMRCYGHHTRNGPYNFMLTIYQLMWNDVYHKRGYYGNETTIVFTKWEGNEIFI